MTVRRLRVLEEHVTALRTCRQCPDMIGPVVTGRPVMSPVMLIGQAPGDKEGPAGKPFAWTAGKTLFKWFGDIGLDEEGFRSKVYMAAVCRCFPGKNPKGGDRVPSPDEVVRCGVHLAAEVKVLQPRLILPVGKLAIAQVMPEFGRSAAEGIDTARVRSLGQLAEVVGKRHRVRFHGVETDIVPLPHPSGASTWHRTEPGKSLLAAALAEVGKHEAWRGIV